MDKLQNKVEAIQQHMKNMEDSLFDVCDDIGDVSGTGEIVNEQWHKLKELIDELRDE